MTHFLAIIAKGGAVMVPLLACSMRLPAGWQRP